MTASQRDAIARSLHAQPHRILGVPVDADEPTLRRAYRAAAKLLHPDKCTLPDAEAAFKRVSMAFEQLLTRAPVASSKAPAAASYPVPSHPPPAAPAAPAATVWPSRNRAGGAKFTVHVAQAPRSRAPTRRPAQTAAAAVEEEDEPEVADESSDEESSDEESSFESIQEKGSAQGESGEEDYDDDDPEDSSEEDSSEEEEDQAETRAATSTG